MKNMPVFPYCRLAIALAAAFTVPISSSHAADYVVTTLAGSGSPTARDGFGTIGVKFLAPSGVAIDTAGNIYVADKSNHLIRKISAAGLVTTLAGDGTPGFVDGSGVAARFNGPNAVAVDSSGTVFIADGANNRVRKLSPDGTVTTLAGSTVGYQDGTGSAAQFANPAGVAIDASGNIYVSDSINHRIRRIDTSGVVTTVAGSGSPAYGDGSGTLASFQYPTGLAMGGSGYLYVADQNNNRIRRVTSAGEVTTIAGDSTAGYFDGTGTASAFSSPAGLVLDTSGNIFVADSMNQRVRKISVTGVVSTLAGSGTSGKVDGNGTGAQFAYPASLALDGSGNLFVADMNNNVIREIDTGYNVTTFAGSSGTFLDGTGTATEFKNPYGIARDNSGNLFVADALNHAIRKVTQAGVVSTLAGDGTSGYQDGTGSGAKFNNPTAVAVDGSGNVFVADQNNQRIRKITDTGVVLTLAGNGTAGYTDGLSSAARFNNPAGIALDTSGNIYIADFSNNRIRMIDNAGAVTTLAGSGSSTYADGSGTFASFSMPSGVAVNTSNNIIVADRGNNRIRSITPSGVVSTLAGSGTASFLDGTGAGASFNMPSGLAVDGSGNVYVADSSNNRIRQITAGGVVSTIAGSTAGFLDGTGTAVRFANPYGVAVSPYGELFVADSNNQRIRMVSTTLSTPVFSAVSGAALSTVVESAAFTISGLSGSTSSAIFCPAGDASCGYKIDNGSFSKIEGTVYNGQSVVVRITSASTYSTSVQVSLTLGGKTGTFSVTTQAAPVVVDNTPPPVVTPPVVIPTPPTGVTIVPVTDPSTVFTGNTGATIDPNTGVVVLPSTVSSTPVVLSSTVPANVGIKPATNVPVTFVNAQGNSVKITGLTDSTLLVTRQVGTTTLIEVATGTARIEPSSNTVIPLVSKTDQSVGSLAPSPGAAPTAVIVRRDNTGIAAFIETGTTVYKSVDSHGTSVPDATVYSGETANFSTQGAVDQVKLGSLDGDRNLPGDPIKNIPNVDPGLIVPQLGGNVARLGGESVLDSLKNQIDTALGSPPGAEVSFDPSSGVVVYKLNGVEARFIPLGNLLISLTGFSDNGFVATNPGQVATGTFKLVDRGVQLTLASTLGYFTDFDTAVKANDPAGKVTLKASGALWIDMLGNQYITQPGYLSQNSGIIGKPNVALADDGKLSFRDSKGGVQALYPTLADAGALQTTLGTLVPDASVKLQGDGTAAASLAGHDFTLLPQYNLVATPGKYSNSSWWLDNNTIYYTLPSLGKAQGFTVK